MASHESDFQLPEAREDPLDAALDKQRMLARMFGLGEAPRLEHYELQERLGSGAMGVVYAAHDRKLDRQVAIKRIRAELGGDRRRLLEREAQAMARLSHPNVV
ncbi:MAG: protein kinase, partial [Myxococcales bacterium]|nr:protein kinase [Myxococcales bacterium]